MGNYYRLLRTCILYKHIIISSSNILKVTFTLFVIGRNPVLAKKFIVMALDYHQILLQITIATCSILPFEDSVTISRDLYPIPVHQL
jgi:hypothetical protein